MNYTDEIEAAQVEYESNSYINLITFEIAAYRDFPLSDLKKGAVSQLIESLKKSAAFEQIDYILGGSVFVFWDMPYPVMFNGDLELAESNLKSYLKSKFDLTVVNVCIYCLGDPDRSLVYGSEYFRKHFILPCAVNLALGINMPKPTVTPVE